MELRHDRVPISVTEILPSGINTPLFDKARTRIGVKPKPGARDWSLSTWLQMHPWARRALTLALVGGMGLLSISRTRK